MAEVKPLYLDYCKFVFYIRRLQIIKWLFYSILPFTIIIVFYNTSHETYATLSVQVFIAIIMTLFIIIIWILLNLYHSHLAHYHDKKEGHIPFELQIDDDGLIISDTFAKSEVKWDRFKKIVETNSMFLFWLDKATVMWLPKKQISNTIGIKSFIVNNFNGKKKLKKEKTV